MEPLFVVGYGGAGGCKIFLAVRFVLGDGGEHGLLLVLGSLELVAVPVRLDAGGAEVMAGRRHPNQQAAQHQDTQQQLFERNHGVTSAGRVSKRTRLRPRMIAISLPA